MNWTVLYEPLFFIGFLPDSWVGGLCFRYIYLIHYTTTHTVLQCFERGWASQRVGIVRVRFPTQKNLLFLRKQNILTVFPDLKTVPHLSLEVQKHFCELGPRLYRALRRKTERVISIVSFSVNPAQKSQTRFAESYLTILQICAILERGGDRIVYRQRAGDGLP